MEHPLDESAWRRGWKDTKTLWASPWFYVLDPVGAVLMGSLLAWYWGLVIVVSGMACVWLGATAYAPIKQRNAARKLLLEKPKPIPLPNRTTLIRAMAEFADAAIEVINRQEYLDKMDPQNPNLVHVEAMATRDRAYQSYMQAYRKIGSEKLVAGQAFGQPISDLIVFISAQVFFKTQKPPVYANSPLQVFTPLELTGRIGGKVVETIRKIDEISG